MRETTNILLDTYESADKTSWLTTYNENLEKVDQFAGAANSRIQQNETNITTINNEIELINTNIATLSEAGTGNSSSISELQNSLRDTNENVLANTNKNNLQDRDIGLLMWQRLDNIVFGETSSNIDQVSGDLYIKNLSPLQELLIIGTMQCSLEEINSANSNPLTFHATFPQDLPHNYYGGGGNFLMSEINESSSTFGISGEFSIGVGAYGNQHWDQMNFAFYPRTQITTDLKHYNFIASCKIVNAYLNNLLK